MRTLTALLLAAPICAVETSPCRVLYVGDGDTIGVALPGTPAVEATVRLKWVDTPERHDNPHDAAMPEGESAATFLRALLPRGTQVALWSPAADWEHDETGRLIALVRHRAAGAPADSAQWPTAQEALIRAGWTVYWRRYGEAPEPLRHSFTDAEQQARKAGAGAWATAGEWMQAKGKERWRE